MIINSILDNDLYKFTTSYAYMNGWTKNVYGLAHKLEK